ncbi:hypothetical protein [Pedobacter sp. MC2016-24]|uniref:hypothetical protein n=1 Tax=Pedobacter sp. MC2016-24 TaxID=2780090 RepID=UPI0018822C49|nr:hypothetical protein [Pedobacter sp. MC2016-24]MBE9598750.1 hypothetical protein [Pedobacter sp. MC2016-24]
MQVTYKDKIQLRDYYEHLWNSQDANMIKEAVNSKADLDLVYELIENVKIEDFEYVQPTPEGELKI